MIYKYVAKSYNANRSMCTTDKLINKIISENIT